MNGRRKWRRARSWSMFLLVKVTSQFLNPNLTFGGESSTIWIYSISFTGISYQRSLSEMRILEIDMNSWPRRHLRFIFCPSLVVLMLKFTSSIFCIFIKCLIKLMRPKHFIFCIQGFSQTIRIHNYLITRHYVKIFYFKFILNRIIDTERHMC